MDSDPDIEDSDPDVEQSPGIFDALLTPLRVPGRVVADVAALAQAAGNLVQALGTLQQSIDRIDDRVEKLGHLEGAVGDMMQGLREDVNMRMVALRDEVSAIHPPMDQIARDVAKIDRLIPDPSDGPLTRLKDTLSSSGT